MEAKELQIGDWVLLSDTPVCVRAINSINNQYYIEAERWKLSARNYASMYEPIPLTEEMIRANIDLFKDNDDIDIVKDVRGFILDYSNGVLLNMGIEYVHELQHALRLCGLDDLADNFKVS